MANYNNTVFQCDSPEVLNAFKSACERDGKNHEIFIKDNNVHLSTPWDTGHDTAAAISKQYPDEVITCFYSFEDVQYSEIYKYEYSAGESMLVDLTPNYMVQVIDCLDEVDSDAIVEKAQDFCRMLDVVEKSENGKIKINWFDAEVVFTFEHQGQNGKKYKVEAEKNYSQIYFKIFESVREWRLIEKPGVIKHVSVRHTPQDEVLF
jgi:hypothetical protein